MSDKPTAPATTIAEVAAVTRAAAESAKERVDAGKPLPVTQARELASATLALVERLEPHGRPMPAAASTTPDGHLVDRASIALGSPGAPLPRKELAARLGFGPGSAGLVGPTRLAERPLSEERRDMLRRWIAGEK